MYIATSSQGCIFNWLLRYVCMHTPTPTPTNTHTGHIAIHVHWLSQYLNAHVITHVEMMMLKIYQLKDKDYKGNELLTKRIS